MQKRALVLSADLFEDSELLVPKEELERAGVSVDVASLQKGTITGKHGHTVVATLVVSQADLKRYDLLVVPGGKAPATLRHNAAALDLVRRFMASDKPVAAICHGPELLAAAGALHGRQVTGHRGTVDELRKAGAEYEDAEVVVDRNLISSRSPRDLPAFTKAILRALDRQTARVGVPHQSS